MTTCKYCGTTYQNYQPTCSGCGAVLSPEEKSSPQAPDQQSLPATLQQICQNYEDNKDFLPGEYIPKKRLTAAQRHFKIFPKDSKIILFCDISPFRKGKRGFIVCDDGLYWHNGSTPKTNRNYLSWQEIAKRDIKLDEYTIDLGRGDQIGGGGLGSDANRNKAVRLLKDIQALFKH